MTHPRQRIELREPADTDAAAVADLLTRCYPYDPVITADTVRWGWDRADPARPSSRVAAFDGDRVVGSGYLRGVPGRRGLLLNVEVDHAVRRRGIGTRIWEALRTGIGPGSPHMWAMVSEGEPAGLAFLGDRGFAETDRIFESVLDLTTFDPDDFRDVREAARARGLRFSTMALEDSDEMRRKVHALDLRLEADVPARHDIQPTTFEQFTADWLDAAHARPDLLVLALDGDEPVAVSSVNVPSGSTGYNHMTGVASTHRGRGLGLAVKAEALRLAKAAGLTRVITDNHAGNAPMLAINARLGYQAQPTWIHVEREAS